MLPLPYGNDDVKNLIRIHLYVIFAKATPAEVPAADRCSKLTRQRKKSENK